MDNPIRLSILGFGGMAHYHVERLQKTGLVQIVGVYDTDDAQMADARKRGYIAYPSADTLLHDKAAEAVLIATPNDVHCPYAVLAAEAGKHILCEKPVALSVQELDIMAKAAQQNGVVFTVHQNRRWDSDFIAARQIIESGVLGRIYRIES